ncbi:cytochrome P450 [Iningainema tapete]|uniref:Cytochrome P450 n=1 Tax=Iningainema tapete BLCC-T55 TaxID=2748662 RepID=A0A8J7C630_9CYAN|nr:cytochrome P450 [Iningainema tapete]MBD2773804.1 cytochrome P450 [Iningainema tapete BLCC-T55]
MQLPNVLKTPSVLQKLQWVVDPVQYMESAAQQYPDIFSAEVIGFGGTVVFVNHPQAIQEIFTNERNKFAAVGEVNRIFQPIIGDYGMLLLDGDRHKRLRQLLIPPFHGERLQAYSQLICHLTEKVFSQLSIDKPFVARTALQEISLSVILQIVFGVSEGERYQQLKNLLVSLLDVFDSPVTSGALFFPFLQQNLGAWSPWGRFLRQRSSVDELLYTEIAERRKQSNSDRIDILSLLISAKDEEGQSLTDQELHDQLMSMLLAGYETTATTMAWAFYWIHQKPEVLKKLLQELDKLDDYRNFASIVRLPYLSAVCNETMRIYPVGMFAMPRVVQQPVKLVGHPLEPGTLLLCCIYLTHHNQDSYPQPKEFKPERFLERQFSPYEFMPFGGGVRRCIGDALAVFQMKLVLVTILSRYQLALVDRQPERPQRRGFTLAPSRGVKLVIRGRRVSQESRVTTATTPA